MFTNIKKIIIATKFLVFFSLVFALFGVLPQQGKAATLSVGPPVGTFTVGSIFNVSLFLDTEKEFINALGISMSFSPDKLQLISPSTGKSIIGVWTASPQFNNQTGRIELQGGIPNGINVSNGLVTTLTFRVKSVGSAILKFLDGSRVLLNDGLGTDALKNTTNGIYQLVLPPPLGPTVVSQTHPRQSEWYSNPNVILKWDLDETVEAYSYILNKEPVDSLDNISEGQRTSVVYKNLSDGIYYFHIKAIREGAWGGTTHFAIQIDTTAPAEFSVDIIPSSRTTRKQPVVQFSSTDARSGIDHYELKIVPLTLKTKENKNVPLDQPLFIEVQSPYVLSPLELGKYDAIVRVYDKSGNYRESVKRFSVVNVAFQFIGESGFEIKNVVFIPWFWFWLGSAFFVMILFYGALRIRKWHYLVVLRKEQKALPQDIRQQLEELQRYKSKYGPKALLFLLLIFGSLLILPNPVFARQIELAPPLISTVSRNISNEEIFYVGGKTEVSKTEVILYMQNLQTGETVSQTIASDKNGEWFYRHDAFLLSGKYLLWAQNKIQDQLSPPGPQIQMTVNSTAIQFGSSRISYEILYLAIVIILFFAVFALIIYIIFHIYHGRKKHTRFIKEVKEAKESVRRGFAVLKRDIEAELALVLKAKLGQSVSTEIIQKETQLLEDLDAISKHISKEIWDVEQAEYFN